MNNKELTTELTRILELPKEKISALLEATAQLMAEELSKGTSVNMQGFGVFESRRKEERVSVNPRTKVRTLIPPKQVLVFKPSNSLKEKAKQSNRHE
jgi:DNA-binding protein HU-beta